MTGHTPDSVDIQDEGSTVGKGVQRVSSERKHRRSMPQVCRDLDLAESVGRFYAMNRIDFVQGLPADGSHRMRLLPLVRA